MIFGFLQIVDFGLIFAFFSYSGSILERDVFVFLGVFQVV